MTSTKFLPLFLLLTISIIACQKKGNQPIPDALKFIAEVSDPTEKQGLADQLIDSLEQTNQIPFIQDGTVTYLLKSSAKKTSLVGAMNDWSPRKDPMTLLEGTDLWYYHTNIEPNARMEYKFVQDNNWSIDPRNKQTTKVGRHRNSVILMPEYKIPTEVVYDSTVVKGKLDTLKAQKDQWDLCRSMVVYTPPDYYFSAQKYPLVIFHDGHNQINVAQVPTILDNLIHAGKIRPCIAVFLEPDDRERDYAYGRRFAFAEFVAKELIPFMDQSYRTEAQATSRATIGSSFGGLISVIIAYSHPEVFGHCGALSCAFWPNNQEPLEFIKNNMDKPINYAAIWGSYDGVRKNNQKVIKAFEAKGKSVFWKELPEGHNWGLWRANTDEILIQFFPPR